VAGCIAAGRFDEKEAVRILADADDFCSRVRAREAVVGSQLGDVAGVRDSRRLAFRWLGASAGGLISGRLSP